MQNEKKIILFIIDSIKHITSLSTLNALELKGFTSTLSKLRFFPNTKVTMPFSLGRTVRGVSFDKNLLLDPAGKLCNEILNNEDDDVIYNNLSEEFEKQKFLSAADIVCFRDNHILKNYPAWALVMPWEKVSIEEMFDSYPRAFYKNRISKGLVFESSSRKSIVKLMYSSEFIENRIAQYKNLFESIQKNGILRPYDIPKVNILLKGNEWRWFMGDGGNHRSYIFSSMGHSFFTVRVNAIINKNEINNWHNVKNGTYSVEEAEKIFDNYFDGSKVYRGMV